MRPGRRDFLKLALAAGVVPPVEGRPAGREVAGSSAAAPPAARRAGLLVDATAAPPVVRQGHLRMGEGRAPDGRVLAVDNRSLVLQGVPRLPVMGEIHYSRYPDDEWRDALLAMKAGGVEVASTYVFWIHHEEVEGEFDWSGRRSLRRFVELCREAGLMAVVRCGPWCHGEVRNGGLPDWILRKGFKVRSNTPGYMAAVRRLYAAIAGQLSGLLWKDGGPVIAIQFENEYEGPAEHLLALKGIARELGVDVPLYTRTGWPKTTTPLPIGEMVPLFGSYAEGFWDRVLTPMPGKYGEGFLFKLGRIDPSVAMGPQADAADEDAAYPYFCCEIGGGMAVSYHRRIRMAPRDVEAAAHVKLGSGNNLQGYYMYHGGTNPEGRLTTLQESQATNYWNDVPVKSYDFQAPLGEFGQVREHYHRLRRTHLFLHDFGSVLATLPASVPEVTPQGPKDTETLRWCVRSDGRRGVLFVNNYQRLQAMGPKDGVQFRVRLQEGIFTFPPEPVTVPADSFFFWPFNLDLGGAALAYATAQPLCRLDEEDGTCFVFVQTKGVRPDFAFERKGVTLEHAAAEVEVAGQRVHVRNVAAGTGEAMRLRTSGGARVSVVLLDEARSLSCWKGRFAGRERLFLSRAALLIEDDRLRLTAADAEDLQVAMLPAPPALACGGAPVAGARDGIFTTFRVEAPPRGSLRVAATRVKEAGPARPIATGSQGVAEAPAEGDFAAAAVWRLRFEGEPGAASDPLLRLTYVGDVARVLLEGKLLTDNFYNGTPFEVGLRRLAPDILRQELLLQILPLRRGAPFYLPDDAWPDFAGAESAVALAGVDLLQRCRVELRPQLSAGDSPGRRS